MEEGLASSFHHISPDPVSLSLLSRALARPGRLARLALLGATVATGAAAQTAVLDPVTGEPALAAAPFTGDIVASEASSLAPVSDLTLVARLADGETRGIALVGSTLYRSNGGYLEALDVTTPTAPVVLGRFLAPDGVVQGVAVQGSLAYVPVSRGTPYATRGSLQIVDVSNPAAMQFVGAVTGRSFFEATVAGTTVYGATGGGGLRLFDVSNPAAPVAQGFLTVSGGSVLSVVVEGSLAYLAAGNAGFRAVDVSNPAAPAVVGSLDVGGFATRVAVAGTRAYVAVNDVGLVVIDITNPAAPALLGTFPIASGQVRSVAVAGTTAYVGRDDGFVAVNVANPAAMTLLGQTLFGVSGSGQSIVLDGTRAYVGNRYSGVRVIDVSNPATPTPLHLIDNGGFSFKVNVVGSTAYVVDLLGQVRLVDLSTPTAPAIVGRVRNVTNASGADVLGSTLYIAQRNDPPAAGVTRVDVSNPSSPTVLGFSPTARSAYGVDVDGQTVFVATGVNGTTDGAVVSANGAGGGFAVLDTEATGNQAFDVRVSNGRAYVATFGSGLSILDVSNPAAMAPLSLNTVGDFSSSLEVDGTMVYLANSVIGTAQALMVIDASNPAAPTVLATADGIQGGTSVDVGFGDGRAYAAVDFVGLYEYDVTNPAAPVARPVRITADRATGVDVEGRLVVVADAGAGIWVFQTPPIVAGEAAPAEAFAVTAGPNPTRGDARLHVALGEAAPVQVEVFSVLGARVATLDLGVLPVGTHTVALDGHAWAPGVYVYRLTAGAQTATGRLTVTR